MSITANMVKELRDRTGAGMMECKKALVEADGDAEQAAEILRKSGQAKADKKSGRIAADGRIVVAVDGSKAAVVEINSETDFVARDENFIAFSDAIAAAALETGVTDTEVMADVSLSDGRTVEEARTDLISKVGENISVRRIATLASDDVLASYTHGSRIGVAVAMSGGDEALARDLAMHIAASNPMCIDEAGVPAETLDSERRILTEQAKASGKPSDIVDKMVEGRLGKFLKEVTLLGQPFVKDPETSVGKLLGKAGATVTGFVRFEVGEGIEKREENFADEVMKQVRDAAKSDK
jgi:elongation factor Ts